MVSERLVSRTTVLWDMGRTTKTLAASVSRGAQIGRFLRMQPLPLPAPKSGLGPVSPPQPELRTRLFHSERLFQAPLTVFPRGTQTPLSRGSRAPFTSLSPSGLPLRSVTSHPFLLFFKGDVWPQQRLAAHWKVHVVISWC